MAGDAFPPDTPKWALLGDDCFSFKPLHADRLIDRSKGTTIDLLLLHLTAVIESRPEELTSGAKMRLSREMVATSSIQIRSAAATPL